MIEEKPNVEDNVHQKKLIVRKIERSKQKRKKKYIHLSPKKDFLEAGSKPL